MKITIPPLPENKPRCFGTEIQKHIDDWKDPKDNEGGLVHLVAFSPLDNPSYLHFKMVPARNDNDQDNMRTAHFLFHEPYTRRAKIFTWGDMAPSYRGVISDVGYGLPWFVRKQGWDYLASKFLERPVWDSHSAKDHMYDHLAYMREEIQDILENFANENDRRLDSVTIEELDPDEQETIRGYRLLRNKFKDHVFESQTDYECAFYNDMVEMGYEADAIWPSSRYDFYEAVRLSAQQRLFGRCFHRQFKMNKDTGEIRESKSL
jgi:hypothetical protein